MTILSKITCTECDHENERNRARCDRCDEKLGSGYPNVNIYSDSYFQNGLIKRYQKALKPYESNYIQQVIEPYEKYINKEGKIVINMNIDLLYELVKNKEDYLPYRRAVEQNKRLISKIYNDHKRSVVDTSFYGLHGADIVFAALSGNEKGLISYGPIAVILQEKLVKKRLTVFEKNSFFLYDHLTKHQGWNPAEFPPPSGFFAIWNDRALLGVIKCHSTLKKNSNSKQYENVLLTSNGDRSTDEFLELHIFNKITYLSFKKVSVHTTFTDRFDQANWKIIEEVLALENIESELS